jgi:hypothetical protein
MLIKVYNTRHASRQEILAGMIEYELPCVPRVGESIELPDLRDGVVGKVVWVPAAGRKHVEIYVR